MALTVNVPEKLICCSSCVMWVVFENSGVECNFASASDESYTFICKKCVRLQELEELQKNCNCNCKWSVVCKGSKAREGQSEETVPLILQNGFEGLSVDEGVVEMVVEAQDSQEIKLKTKGRWEGDKSKGRMVLCGDSLVRYVDREFCGVDR